MTRPAPWTDAENAAVITLYFRMLTAAMAGEPYNKAQMIRHTQSLQLGTQAPPLAARSRGSIESKLMNCSACHRDIGNSIAGRITVTMDGFGYRCLSNYQAALKTAIAKRLPAFKLGTALRHDNAA